MVSCHNATCTRWFLPIQLIPAWSRPIARTADTKKPEENSRTYCCDEPIMKESDAEKKFREDGVVVIGSDGDGRGRSDRKFLFFLMS